VSETTENPPGDLILGEAEVARRMLLLAELHGALEAEGVRCVLARIHRLVMRSNDCPCKPSGLADPQLHVFLPGGTGVVTTDGTTYRLAGGEEFAVADPAAAASVICRLATRCLSGLTRHSA
jgi:hypothetical protein